MRRRFASGGRLAERVSARARIEPRPVGIWPSADFAIQNENARNSDVPGVSFLVHTQGLT